MQLLKPLFVVGSWLASLPVPNTWHHLQDKEETTLGCLVHQDVSDLSEHCLPWISLSCASAYRGPWWAWRPCHHPIHTLPLPLVDIEDVTFNVTQFKLAGSLLSVQICQGPPQMFPNIIDVDGMEVNTQCPESVACTIDAHARQCQRDRDARTQHVAQPTSPRWWRKLQQPRLHTVRWPVGKDHGLMGAVTEARSQLVPPLDLMLRGLRGHDEHACCHAALAKCHHNHELKSQGPMR